MAHSAMPVLVGVGQLTSRWEADRPADKAPSPKSLCIQAARLALTDAGIGIDEIDTVAVVRIFEDSVPGGAHPHGHNSNLAGTIVRDLGAKPAHTLYAAVGGHSPQQLANEMAARISAGETDCALITGAEANRASKAANKRGISLNWQDASDREIEDRGLGEMLLSRSEIKHGIVLPAYFYSLIENAMAAKLGQTRTDRRVYMSDLFARFAAVAAGHPQAQFDTSTFTPDFLATPSRQNYPFADPFLKWHIAQDAVNQGAALIMMSDAKADRLGIPEAKRVYLHGGGEASDDFLSERPNLSGSWAMHAALQRALSQANKTPADIDVFDLYSCFPCAVFSALDALGIDHSQEMRALTVTGGLPFFGGPGNNYSMHALVSMAETLRRKAGAFGLVLANGGWLTKEAVGIWSTQRPDDFIPVEAAAKPVETVPIEVEPAAGVIETYTITYDKNGPQSGIVFARTKEAKRFIAQATPSAMPRLLAEDSPVGLPITVVSENQRNRFTFA